MGPSRPSHPVVRIRGTIRILGVNPYVRIPRTSVTRLRLGWKRPMPVRFRINGLPRVAWRLNLTPTGDGSFRLHLNGIVRRETETAVGDRVAVELEFDAAYRGGPAHPMPPTLDRGLKRSSRAKAAWDALRPSVQKEFLRYLAALKSEDAKARNVERALRVLNGEEERFLGRSWRGGQEVVGR